MERISASFILSAICVAFILAEGHYYAHCTSSEVRCKDYYRSCSDEDPRLANESSKEAGDSYGPNVCVTSKTYEAESYVFKEVTRCRRGRCWTLCTRTNECIRRNFTRTKVECCDGFAINKSSSVSHGGHRWRHRQSNPLRTEGCPIVLKDTVQDCLKELNLTMLIDELSRTDLEPILSSPNARLTVFAPSDAAFNSLTNIMRLELLPDDSVNTTLAAHIADCPYSGRRLSHGSRIKPLAEDRCLHVTEVNFYMFRRNISERTFINGAEVTNADACRARNGIVHVVDSVIPTSPSTITEILRGRSTLSTFVSLLDEVGASKYLSRPKKSRTVFAPTNAAFDDLPGGSVECLMRPENRWALKTLVYIHVSAPAEYTSSLALRDYLYTFSRFYIAVNGSEDDIRITRDEIPLEDTNIPAKNGVIHTIGTVLIPDCIDLEMLCPDMPSPTTSMPTASSSVPVPPLNPLPTVAPMPGGPIDPSPSPPVIVEPPEGGGINPTNIPVLGK